MAADKPWISREISDQKKFFREAFVMLKRLLSKHRVPMGKGRGGGRGYGRALPIVPGNNEFPPEFIERFSLLVIIDDGSVPRKGIIGTNPFIDIFDYPYKDNPWKTRRLKRVDWCFDSMTFDYESVAKYLLKVSQEKYESLRVAFKKEPIVVCRGDIQEALDKLGSYETSRTPGGREAIRLLNESLKTARKEKDGS
jgi:hypothetical protein